MDLYYGKAGHQRGAASGQGLRCTSGLPFPLRSAKQVRQLGDAGRDLSRLVLRHQAGRCAPSRFIGEIDVGDRELVGIADDVRDAAIFLDGPRCREAAIGHRGSIRQTYGASFPGGEGQLASKPPKGFLTRLRFSFGIVPSSGKIAISARAGPPGARGPVLLSS